MSQEQDIRKYLESKVDLYLKPLLLDVLRQKPENVHEFIKNWM